jgi:hypothetical protein
MYFVKFIIKLEGVLYMIDYFIKNIHYVKYCTYADKHRRSLFNNLVQKESWGEVSDQYIYIYLLL